MHEVPFTKSGLGFGMIASVVAILMLIAPTVAFAFSSTGSTGDNSYFASLNASSGTGSVAGTVTDSDGYGVAGAELEIVIDGVSYFEWSGPNGEYHFLNLPNNQSYTIAASKSGHTSQNSNGSTASPTVQDFELSPQQYELSGVVVDSDNTPLEGVAINAGSAGNAVTDDLGRFSLQVPYGTQYKIFATLADYHFINNEIEGTLAGDEMRVLVGVLD